MELLAHSESVSTSQPADPSVGSCFQGFVSLQRYLAEPRKGQGVKPAPVPLSGFLSLSAAS